MSLSIVTFANLGKKRNLKTADIVPVVETFVEYQELGQVICQISKGFYFKNTQSAIPAPIHYIIRAFEKIFHLSLSRDKMEELFDFFAASRLQKANVVLFHPARFARTMYRAKKNKSITVGIAAAAHPLTSTDLYTQELDRLNAPQELYLEASKDNLIANKFDYVIAMSEFAKDTYVQSSFPSERVFVAYPDIDTSRFVPIETKKGKFRVLYMAHTTPLKGLHYLLEAWNDLQLPDAKLVLVGGYGIIPTELKQRYDALVAKNPTIQTIESSAAPEAYYRDSSVLVLPSLTEGFGRVTLEAMACGLPVITTENARGIVEDGKTGFVVPIRDANALAEKIKYLYDHRDIAGQMGKEARKAVENKKPFGEAVYEIYREILRREHKI